MSYGAKMEGAPLNFGDRSGLPAFTESNQPSQSGQLQVDETTRVVQDPSGNGTGQ